MFVKTSTILFICLGLAACSDEDSSRVVTIKGKAFDGKGVLVAPPPGATDKDKDLSVKSSPAQSAYETFKAANANSTLQRLKNMIDPYGSVENMGFAIDLLRERNVSDYEIAELLRTIEQRQLDLKNMIEKNPSKDFKKQSLHLQNTNTSLKNIQTVLSNFRAKIEKEGKTLIDDYASALQISSDEHLENSKASLALANARFDFSELNKRLEVEVPRIQADIPVQRAPVYRLKSLRQRITYYEMPLKEPREVQAFTGEYQMILKTAGKPDASRDIIRASGFRNLTERRAQSLSKLELPTQLLMPDLIAKSNQPKVPSLTSDSKSLVQLSLNWKYEANGELYPQPVWTPITSEWNRAKIYEDGWAKLDPYLVSQPFESSTLFSDYTAHLTSSPRIHSHYENKGLSGILYVLGKSQRAVNQDQLMLGTPTVGPIEKFIVTEIVLRLAYFSADNALQKVDLVYVAQ